MNSDLIERVNDYLCQCDPHVRNIQSVIKTVREAAELIEEMVAALSPVLPEDVQDLIECFQDYTISHQDCDCIECRTIEMLERLALKITSLEQRIAELEAREKEFLTALAKAVNPPEKGG